VIAVTFALPSESSEFRRLVDEQNPEVAILHTGVGEEVCRQRLGPFLASRDFRFLISSGFAGGVDPSLGIGDLLLAENFSDPQLMESARALLIAQVGKLITSGSVIESETGRAQLAKAQGAAAVDMETACIAEACAARNLPMLSLRAISDTAAAPFPLPATILFDLARQKTNLTKLSGYLLRHPAKVVRLMRFARQVATARASLTNALVVLVRELRE
jgi:adenosylhomocysteine nucleosidase